MPRLRTTRRTSDKPPPEKRSHFEDDFEVVLNELGVPYRYEKLRLKYTVEHTYTPDWELLKSGVIVETKGYLETRDRTTLAHIKQQHPTLDIRVLFQKRAEAHRPIYKGSQTTNAHWLEAHGIPWAAEALPLEWTLERASKGSAKLAPVRNSGEAAKRSLLDPRSWGDDIPILTKAQRTRAAKGKPALQG